VVGSGRSVYQPSTAFDLPQPSEFNSASHRLLTDFWMEGEQEGIWQCVSTYGVLGWRTARDHRSELCITLETDERLKSSDCGSGLLRPCCLHRLRVGLKTPSHWTPPSPCSPIHPHSLHSLAPLPSIFGVAAMSVPTPLQLVFPC
jgi:hypothetical protein